MTIHDEDAGTTTCENCGCDPERYERMSSGLENLEGRLEAIGTALGAVDDEIAAIRDHLLRIPTGETSPTVVAMIDEAISRLQRTRMRPTR